MTRTHVTLYGIPNCDKVRAARAWLAQQAVDPDFVDYRAQGIPADRLTRWLGALGVRALVNRRSTTWRQLAPAERERVERAADATDAASLADMAALLQAHPTLIKRPVIEWGVGAGDVTVGVATDAWAARLKR